MYYLFKSYMFSYIMFFRPINISNRHEEGCCSAFCWSKYTYQEGAHPWAVFSLRIIQRVLSSNYKELRNL